LIPCIDKTIFVDKNIIGNFIKARDVKMIAGGKGNNVARVISNFGHDVKSLLFLGDHEGRIAANLLKKENIEIVPTWTKARTREVITVVENNYRQTVYFEPSPKISGNEIKDFTKNFKREIKKCEIVIFAGSSPCSETDNLYFDLINIAKDIGVLTFLDSSNNALRIGIKAKPFLVKPNLKEAEILFNRDIKNIEDMIDFLDFLENKNIELPILSLGKDGALFKSKGNVYKAIPPKVKSINSVGSGDSMIAGIVDGVSKKVDIIDSVRFGVAAGTANSTIWDAAGICIKDVKDLSDKVKIELIN